MGLPFAADFLCLRNAFPNTAIAVPVNSTFNIISSTFLSATGNYLVSRTLSAANTGQISGLNPSQAYRVTISGIMESTNVAANRFFVISLGVTSGASDSPFVLVRAGGGTTTPFIYDAIIQGVSTFTPTMNTTGLNELVPATYSLSEISIIVTNVDTFQ
jgi:hypothetical protein